MATSAYPTFQNYSPLTQVTLHASLKNAQTFSMLTPPIYLLSKLLFRRGMPFSIRSLMNATTRWTVIGAGTGAAAGYARLYNQPPEAVADRAYRLAHNAGQVHTDDYSFIGASLGAIIAPAIFLRRASFPSLVIGGAAIGLGGGTAAHIFQSFTKGEDLRPEAMVAEIPGVRGTEKK